MIKKLLSFLLVFVFLFNISLVSYAQNEETKTNNDSSQFADSDYKKYINDNSALVGYGEDFSINVAEFNISENVQMTPNNTVVIKNNGIATWDFEVETAGAYNFVLEYKPFGDGTEPIELSLLLDGVEPFSSNFPLYFQRYFTNDGQKRVDSEGNEYAPKVKPIDDFVTVKAFDYSGFNNEPYLYIMTEGQHTLTVSAVAEEIEIKSISFKAPEKTSKYSDYLKEFSGKKATKTIVIEGENAISRSKKSIVPLSDNSTSKIYPNNPYVDVLNYIGSNNWSRPGDTIEWEFDVPNTGFYALGFSYRQKEAINEKFYRSLKIDGLCPFEEAKEIEFMYTGSFGNYTFSDREGHPYSLYLEKGKHTLSLSVTMGPFAEICSELNTLVYNLAEFYRSIVMITGETPDQSRDYNLFKQIDNYEGKINSYIKTLNVVLDKLYSVTGTKSGSAATNLRNMVDVLERMIKNKYYAHQYKDRYYSNYSALSAWIYERSEMPVDIDAIFLSSPDKTKNLRNTTLFSNLGFGFKKFIYSFSSDYNSTEEATDSKTINLWINWGRDQAKVLTRLVDGEFTAKTGIKVNIKLTNASLLQGIISGNGPDCSLQVPRSEPVNLAMRGGLYDFSKFDDYKEVLERFMPGAQIPYEYKDGCYGIPNTQTFYMLFYRKDILESMGISVPKTWEEFLNASNLLLRQNMQVGLPYTQITDMNLVNSGVGALNIFPTLLLQRNISIYNEELNKSRLSDKETIETFVYWTNFYNKYGFPKTYNFYNRFRVGLMPMAVVNYSQYATISAAAPEINSLWQMAEIPGTIGETGEINTKCSGGGTAAVILKLSKKPDLAWELVKWWTSAETQYAYASEIENILGTAARHDSANVEALKKLSWGNENLKALLSQWKNVEEINEIPGSYYLSRVVDQAFWNTTNGQDPYEIMNKWSKIADNEIERKCKQYE